MIDEKCKWEYTEPAPPIPIGAGCELATNCDALRDRDARLLSRAMAGYIESRELPSGAYEHVAKETPMHWTTEYPTQPGFYWIRNFVTNYGKARGRGPYPHPRIIWIDDDLDIAWVGNDRPTKREDLAEAEWYGPIEPPEQGDEEEMNQMRFYRIIAEFSDGAIINNSISAKDADEARQILSQRIKRALSVVGQELVAGSDQVSLECVISRAPEEREEE